MNNAARRAARWLVWCVPIVLALVFSVALDAPFAAPKNAFLLVTAFALAALAAIVSSSWKVGRETRWFWGAVAAYLSLTLVSAAISPRRDLCLERAVWPVCGVLLLAATRVAMAGERRARNLRRLQVTISAAAVVVALITAVQFFGVNLQGVLGLYSNYTGRMRMYGTLGNPDFVAAFLAVAVPSTIGLAMAAARGRALWISLSMLICVATVLTGARGGGLALAAGLVAISLAAMGKRTAILLSIVAICALAAGTQFNPRTLGESLRGRFFIWQVSLGEAAIRSAFGSGPGTLSYEYPGRLGRFLAEPGRESLSHFAGNERHAENDFVETWHDTGWLGLMSLIALLLSWFALAMRRLRESENEGRYAISAAIASVSALCVAALFDFPMQRAETWALLWLSLAVPLVPPILPAAPERRRAWWRYSAGALILIFGIGVAFGPLASSYLVAKGGAEEDGGRLAPSLAAYRAAQQWDASSPDARFDEVRVMAKMGDDGGALARAGVAARFVDEPELYLLCSRILHNAGRMDEARREVEAAARRFPYSAELREERASYAAAGTSPSGRPRVQFAQPQTHP